MLKHIIAGIVFPTLIGMSAAASDAMRVNTLLKQGWTILEKTETKEKHKGIAPYENLTRVVQVNTYTMGKDGKVVICRIAYDSQRDKMTETCEAQN